MELTDKIIQSYMNQEVTPPCISLYIPTHPKSTSQRLNEDRIRFKNALQHLEERGAFTEELTDTHAKLVDLIDDNEFWLHRSQGLGIFAGRDGFSTVRLPYELTPVSYQGDKYAVSPLLMMQHLGRTYYVIDIDFDQPRFYAGDEHGLEEMHDIGLPKGLEQEIDVEQRRSAVGSRGGNGGTGTVHYGDNQPDESQTHNVSRYLRLLAGPVNQFLSDKADPLFIAGSPKTTAEFRTMLEYDHVMTDDLSANHGQDRLHDLHAAASSHMTELARANKTAALERYAETNFELRADGMTAVEVAADQGKVDTLLLPVMRITPDGVDSDDTPSPLIELPEDFAAFEAVVRKVAEQSGDIIPVEQTDFADDPSMKAILRY